MTTKNDYEYDHMFKLLIVGDSGVGKSSLVSRSSDGTFPESHTATICLDFKAQTIEVNGERVRLQLWDIGGQDRFRAIASPYYRGADGVIVVYDVTNRESFVNVYERWLNDIEDNCGDISRVLVGNKDDDPEAKIVLTRDAKRRGILSFETSAKDNRNVEEVFQATTRAILKKRKKKLQNRPPEAGPVHRLHDRAPSRQKACCK